MELADVIQNRRSIRKFTDYFVTDAEITRVLEAARLAPSWANTQVWEFIIVRDRSLIASITDTYSELNPARKCSLAATALIVACAKRGVSACYDGIERTKFSNWFMFDLGMAVQNICLRAHDIGLGTVVVGLMDHDAVKKLLNLPDPYEAVVVIPIGEPAVAAKEGPARKELSTFVHLNAFGNVF